MNIVLNTTLLAAIVALTEAIKKFDKGEKLKKFYVYMPIPLGILSAFLVTDPFSLREWGINSMVYISFASFGYNIIKQTIKNFLKR